MSNDEYRQSGLVIPSLLNKNSTASSTNNKSLLSSPQPFSISKLTSSSNQQNTNISHKEIISKLSERSIDDEPVFIEYIKDSKETTSTTTTTTTYPETKLKKCISSKRDLKCFQSSSTYFEFLHFIIQLSLDTQGKPLSHHLEISNNVNNVIGLLDTLDQYCNEIPPKLKRTRFGNESFVEWFDKIEKETPRLIYKLLNNNEEPNDEILNNETSIYREISGYLINCFGDRTRIDYGSGHEANFICFLLCLVKIKYLERKDYSSLVLRVFYRYLTLMRKLQERYWLEPAGSHGVWGLDDYHFLPFLFGSSQLIEHKHIRPKSIRSDEIVNSFSKDFMYLGCIDFILKVKTGSLLEHSPMLVDISGVKNWSKVNEGMIKMYKVELLNKLPIMQHFLFGTLLPFVDNPDIKDDPNDLNQPKPLVVHSFSCCGCIDRVPSVFA
eukprot:gene9137-11195_t